jgi:hypothetical protein
MTAVTMGAFAQMYILYTTQTSTRDIMSMPDRERERAGAHRDFGYFLPVGCACFQALRRVRLSDQGIKYYLSHCFSPGQQSLRAFSWPGTWYKKVAPGVCQK